MSTLILGNGYFGGLFSKFLSCELSEFRVESYPALLSHLEDRKPDVVINCIGKTGRPNIDWCESHRQETAFSNIAVPLMIADACNKLNIKMVHIGTGCIYYGGMEFKEEDAPNCLDSFYSRTKYMCEESLPENVLQLRVRLPTSADNSERNLINKLLKYEKIVDLKNSITILEDFLPAAKRLIDMEAFGVFNVVNPDPVSPAHIMRVYNEISMTPHVFDPISADHLNYMTVAKRSNCTLSVDKLRRYGIYLPPTDESLEKCIKGLLDEKSGRVLQQVA